MHTLHLVSDLDGDNESVSEVNKVRAVREAMRILHADAVQRHGTDHVDSERASASDANKAIEAMRENGVHLLGRSPNIDLLVQLSGALEANGIESVIDLELEDYEDERGPTPEEVFAGEATAKRPDDDEDGDRPVFSTEAYETALVLMVTSEGKPLQAATHAHMLSRTTGDETLYDETMNALIRAFPWIGPTLEANGLIRFEQ